MKKGFTIAEVLITLAVIGVIATLTVPMVNNNMQIKELQTQFKKTYTELEEFARYFESQEMMTASKYAWTYGGAAFYKKYREHAMAQKNNDWSDANKYTMTIPYKYSSIGAPTSIEASSICDASGFMLSNNNRIVSFDDTPKAGYNGPRICVDINGIKGPNMYGYDVFTFLFTIDGSVIPEGEEHPNSNTFEKEDRDNSIGFWWQAGTNTDPANCYSGRFSSTCAYYALNDKSPLDATHTYWKDFIGKKEYLNANQSN